MIKIIEDWFNEALKVASELEGKTMPKWIKRRIRILNLWYYIIHPRNIYNRFKIWRFLKKYPFLKRENK